MTVALDKLTDERRGVNAGAGAGEAPAVTIAGQPVRKITNVTVIFMSGNVRRVTVRPGLFSGSVVMVEHRNGSRGLIGVTSEPRAVVGALVRTALSSGVFAGVRGEYATLA